MSFRVLLAMSAILMLATLSFGQQGNCYFMYPADGVCDAHQPLTYGQCWTGTNIPDGTEITVYKNGNVCYTFTMNSLDICGDSRGGYFVQWDPCLADNGDQLYVQVVHQGCTYTTATFTMSGAPEPQFYYLTESDWNCSCANPGCDVKDEQSGMLLNGSKAKESPGSSK
jgi:hypothetical protein